MKIPCVIELPYDDPRRNALLEIMYNEFATNLLTGLPVQGVLACSSSQQNGKNKLAFTWDYLLRKLTCL